MSASSQRPHILVVGSGHIGMYAALGSPPTER